MPRGYSYRDDDVQDSGDMRPSQVRFAANDEYIPRQRRVIREDSRGSSRRGTQEEVEDAYTDLRRRRYVSDDRIPSRRATPVVVEIPAGQAANTRVTTTTTEEFETEPLDEQTPVIVRYTRSPSPIEDEWRDAPRPRRRDSDDRMRRRFVERSRSPQTERSSRYGWEHQSNAYQESAYHPQSYRPPSVMSDDFDAYDKFAFMAASQVTESSRDGDSDTESPEVEEKSVPREVVSGGGRTAATVVHAAQYTGNAELGGTHSATLTVLHDPKGRKKSLFRWLHVRQEVMNFDDFWIEVSRLHGLSDLEKSAMARLRADVKRNCVRSRYNPKGAKVGYLEPRVFEVSLQSLLKKASQQTQKGAARWVCIPYFALAPYAGLMGASSLAAFPAQTLLQAQYSRNSPQRDMEQAVCQLGTAKRGECFHIAQLWCIVVDNSLLVTCGTMQQADLLDESIKVNEEPSRDVTVISNQAKILVSYGESLTWSFSAQECQTWFAFVSKFQAFWPQVLEFRRKEQVITAEKWPKIVKLASHPQSIVRIVLKTVPRPDPPPRGILRDASEIVPVAEVSEGKKDTKVKAESALKPFNVLTLVPGARSRFNNAKANAENLKAQLAAAEKFLAQETTFYHRKVFKDCAEARRADCVTYLQETADKVWELGSAAMRKAYEERIDVFNAADIMYEFFLPRNFDDPMSKKFWGAVRSIMSMRELDEGESVEYQEAPIQDLRTALRDFTQDIQAFQNIMDHATDEERLALELPREFVTAWLYLVMAVILAASSDQAWVTRLDRGTQLANRSMQKMMNGLCDESLLDRVTVSPLEILSLVSYTLLKDQVGKSDDICETYSQYLNSLEMAITSKPGDRSYQHRIDLVQQEMTAIKRTLLKQRSIIAAIQRSLTPTHSGEVVTRHREEFAVRRSREREFMAPSRAYAHYPTNPYAPPLTVRAADDYMHLGEDANDVDAFAHDITTASRLSPTDAGGLRGLLLLECSRLVDQRDFEFRRYAEYAADLERAGSFRMDFAKDRQENAIFAFTVVTIVFLPLSAVSSVFGMNTSDVRNMEAGQWLYWAVALPVTVVVIVAGLWGMGELGNLARWFMRGPRKGSVGGGPGYAPMMMGPAPEAATAAYLNPGGVAGPSQQMVAMDYPSRTYETANGGMMRARRRDQYAPVMAYSRPQYVPAERW